MDYSIHPLKGVNQIEFGTHAEVVRKSIGGDFEQFRRWKEIYPSDHFDEQGVFCYYDPDGHLEAFEFHEPARVFLSKVNLLSLHFSQAMALLTRLDQEFSRDLDGADFRNLSIGIYAPRAEDDEDVPVEGVLVGRSCYYDEFFSSDNA